MAETNSLLNCRTAISRTAGSNPASSANFNTLTPPLRWFFRKILLALLGLYLCGCDHFFTRALSKPDSSEKGAADHNHIAANLSCGADQVNDSHKKVKNLIFVIGDGMGPQQIGLLYLYAHYAPHSIYRGRRGLTTFEEIMNQGEVAISLVEPTGTLVVDSAASATQLASGEKSRPEMVGSTEDGHIAKTILEIAQERGLATGLITNTRMTHATPAAFAAHIRHRSLENEIASELLKIKPDLMLGGGLRHWLPQEDPQRISARKDSINLIHHAREIGYQIALNRNELMTFNKGKILGLFAPDYTLNGIEEHLTESKTSRTIPTLREMAEKSLHILSQNEKGFFLMIEGGQIDTSAHDNDTGTMLHEMVRFDHALQVLFDWVKKHDDTLLVITADHETGGFGFSYSSHNPKPPIKLTGPLFASPYESNHNYGSYDVLDQLFGQKKSYDEIFKEFEKLESHKRTADYLKSLINDSTLFPISLTKAQKILNVNSGKENLLAQIVSQRQSVAWGTATHTSTPVYFISYGPSSKKLRGVQHATKWAQRLLQIMNTSSTNSVSF